MSKKVKQADPSPAPKEENPSLHKMPVLSPEDAALVEEAPEAEDHKAITDADVLEGGVFGSEISVGEEDAADAPSEAAKLVGEGESEALSPASVPSPESPEKKVYRVGSRTFETPEALAAYVEGLEQSQLDILEKITPKESVKPSDDEIDLATMLFEDPKRALEILESRIEKKIEARELAKESRTKAQDGYVKTWNDFYSANPDLKDFPEVVDASFEQLAKTPEGSKLSIEQGLKLVAEKARNRVNSMKLKLKPAEEVLSRPAITSGSGGAEVPRVANTPIVSDFISEIKSLRK